MWREDKRTGWIANNNNNNNKKKSWKVAAFSDIYTFVGSGGEL